MPYYRGDLARFIATFVASGGAAADATSVYFLTIDPLGVRATYIYNVAGASITRSGVGAYYKDLDLEVAGDWRYRWEGTGGLQPALEAAFNVQGSFKL